MFPRSLPWLWVIVCLGEGNRRKGRGEEEEEVEGHQGLILRKKVRSQRGRNFGKCLNLFFRFWPSDGISQKL
jgi:hypothetical protein